MESKICSKCNEDKPLHRFSKHKEGRLGRSSECKGCRKIYREKTREQRLRSQAEYRDNDAYRLRQREYKLKKSYGITLKEYDKMLCNQEGKCSLCRKEEITIDARTGKVRNLAVDHCHTTKKVRSLLCANCNRGIGYLQDNADLIRKAADYLDNHRGDDEIQRFDKRSHNDREVRE